MSKASDQNYLLHEQYRNASNLNARLQLHQRFSLNTYDWYRWIYDQLAIASESRILELGCGSGRLWLNNSERLPKDWHITLSDFSVGMIQEAQQNLRDNRHSFTFQVIDAQSIPFGDENFDVVIANHMLYHIPDLPQALSEIRRVLRPGGRLYASTFGRKHMQEIDELIHQIIPNAGWWGPDGNASFTLENGREVLSPWFSQVSLRCYDDALRVTEVEPLITYVLSGPAKS